jgi:two-component system chemotaxis response regulator CheY
MKVLIADENIINRKKIRRMIERIGYQVVDEANNGLHTYHKYVECAPDLLVLNINMPLYDGISTIDRILSFNPKASIVVMAYDDQNQILFQALEKGALHYLKLPLQEKLVIKALQEVEVIKRDRRKHV